MTTHKNGMIWWGNVFQYIHSHHFGYWHKYVQNVNMTYIDCNHNQTYDLIHKRNNTFNLLAKPYMVSYNLHKSFLKFYFSNKYIYRKSFSKRMASNCIVLPIIAH